MTTQSPSGPEVTVDGGEPALSVAAVARRLGIAPATLRTWDRRYGVGPSGHTTGRHRRYDSQDIARLELMQRALLRGASPAEAARYALVATRAGSVVDETDQPVAEGGLEPRTVPKARSGSPIAGLPADRRARGLGRAVLAMDSTNAQRLLTDAVRAHGLAGAWDELIQPVLAASAQRWEHTGAGVELVHLLQECVLAVLLRATPLVSAPRNSRPVVLAGVPGERHGLPLHALVAVLAGLDIGTRMLGAALPAEALTSAVRRTAPAAVVLWAQQARYADPALMARLPRTRQRARLFFGGPGWRRVDVDRELLLPDGLGQAAAEIERVVVDADPAPAG